MQNFSSRTSADALNSFRLAMMMTSIWVKTRALAPADVLGHRQHSCSSFWLSRSCLDYDLSADPLGYWEQQLDLYADVQRHLLEMSVAPRESYDNYGRAVHSVVGGFLPDIGINAVYYLGGINNTYLHKYADQTRRSRSLAAQHRLSVFRATIVRSCTPDHQKSQTALLS